MEILLWGAGQDGVKLSKLYRYYPNIYNDDIVGVVDSNSQKWGEVLFGKEIMNPASIASSKWDKIVIASTIYGAAIRKLLIDDYKIPSDYILSFQDYRYGKVIHYQYDTNLKKNEAHGKCDTYRPFNKRSLVVYTAIIGDYDDLRDPLIVEPGVSYVCYTDQKHIKSDVWDIRYIDEVPEEKRAICVREYKMLPHKFFPEYESSIWVDASIKIVGKLTELIEKYQRYANFLLMPHCDGICAYDQIFSYVVYLFTQKSIAIKQLTKYLNEQYPEDNGLMMGGFLVRNHNDSKIIRTMEDWYHEVCFYSSRDQISLPYVVWKNNLIYDLCDLYIAKNSWISWGGHKHIKDTRGADKLIRGKS